LTELEAYTKAEALAKEGFSTLHKFYTKYGFTLVKQKDLPKEFERNPLDSLFFKRKIG